MVIRRASQPLSQGDHNLWPVPVAGEVMDVCHHAASLDFAVARKGCARACDEVRYWLLALSHASETDGPQPGNFNLDETESEIYRSKPLS